MNLILNNIVMRLADFTLDLSVEITAPVTALFGPSGAGKTSLLDLVAGLRRADSAYLQLEGNVLTDTANGVFVPTRFRRIGYVPQDLALFPHLSVRQNLLYGWQPSMGGKCTFDFDHVIGIMEIQPLLERAITHLSGGEKQRVTLARALLASPRLLLLDEPLASLDLNLKLRLLPYLKRIRDEFKVPMLYVSHDPDEVAALCGEVLILQRGRLVRRGVPEEVFRGEEQTRYVLRTDA